MKTKTIIVLDNGGETWDRYTIIDLYTGDMWGASARPFHPQGFGQYCGNVADNYWQMAYGSGWRRNCPPALLQRRISAAVRHFLADCDHVGRRVSLADVPPDVRRIALQMTEKQEFENA